MITTLALTLLLQATPATSTGPVRVYLKPPVEAGGLSIGTAAKDRVDSTADLRKAFDRYDKVLVLVDDPAQAQLTVEVLSRAKVNSGQIEQSTLPGVIATEGTWPSLTVRVTTASGQTGEITEVNKLPMAGWGSAAKGVAWQIQKWIKNNRGKL